jgi:hypothetical protein
LQKHCLDYLRADTKRLTDVMDSEGYQKLSQRQLQDLMAALAPPSDSKKKRKRDEKDAGEAAARCPAVHGGWRMLAGLNADEVKRMKLSELREELGGRGLDTTGLKGELVERLCNAIKS